MADELVKKPGRARGIVGELEARYIKDRHGEEGLAEVESLLDEIGHPFSYGDLTTYEWYSEGQLVTGILAAYLLFGWNESDVYDLGKKAPYHSIFIKVIMKFVSLESTLKMAPTIWSKHYDFGTFFVYEHDTDAQTVKARMHGYEYHSIMREYFKGYLSTIMALGSGVADVRLEEMPCIEKREAADVCREYHAHY